MPRMMPTLPRPEDKAVLVALQQPNGRAHDVALAAILARDQDVKRALISLIATFLIAEEHMAVEALALALYGEGWRERI